MIEPETGRTLHEKQRLFSGKVDEVETVIEHSNMKRMFFGIQVDRNTWNAPHRMLPSYPVMLVEQRLVKWVLLWCTNAKRQSYNASKRIMDNKGDATLTI